MALTLDSTGNLVSREQLQEQSTKLTEALQRVQKTAEAGGYADQYASINLPADELFVEQSENLAKQIGKVDALVVIGIGGSNLGTLAIHEAINGKYHNGLRGPRVFFADTVDADSTRDLVHFVEAYLTNNLHVVLNVISKSGGTTETIANLEVFLDVFNKQGVTPDVVVTTDEGSPMWNLAIEKRYFALPLPSNVGGRYSVLSNVGLFPLSVIGINCRELLQGALEMRDHCLQELDNPAIELAATHSIHAQNGRNIADLFLFSNDLESLGKWYRQLVGESLGKEWNKDHTKQVWAGITPTVSIGSTDLHSMGQLYLGGPQDKFTTFVRVQTVANIQLPDMPAYDALVPHIQKKSMQQLMDAIIQGVQAAYQNQKRPYATITLTDKSPFNLGAFLQLQMMQVIYLAALMDVNPFDQPNVELYKIETKKILKEF